MNEALRRTLMQLRLSGLLESLEIRLQEAVGHGLSHGEFLELILQDELAVRADRQFDRRFKAAQFREQKTLEDFDWSFNPAIPRKQVYDLASCRFLREGRDVLWLGPPGLGKSHLIQAIGQQACVLGYRVRYTTSALVLADLTASLADQTLPGMLREYAKFDLVILDEFGFDRIERTESSQAASLLYKLINARTARSTALVTNIDFEAWGDYLGDPPLAMAFLDRIVDAAIILKINGKSYRAHRAQQASSTKRPSK